MRLLQQEHVTVQLKEKFRKSETVCTICAKITESFLFDEGLLKTLGNFAWNVMRQTLCTDHISGWELTVEICDIFHLSLY